MCQYTNAKIQKIPYKELWLLQQQSEFFEEQRKTKSKEPHQTLQRTSDRSIGLQ